MQKIFHFDCPQEVYQADACIISCFDFRFDLAVRKFLGRRGIAVYDHVKIPGSVKAVVTPNRESDRDFVREMLRTSLRLHLPPRLLLFGHNECGAYPGVAVEQVAEDVVKAAAWFAGVEPGVTVESFFCDFDGIYSL